MNKLNKIIENIEELKTNREEDIKQTENYIKMLKEKLKECENNLAEAKKGNNLDNIVENTNTVEAVKVLIANNEEQLNNYINGAIITEAEYKELTKELKDNAEELVKETNPKVIKILEELKKLADDLNIELDKTDKALRIAKKDLYKDKNIYIDNRLSPIKTRDNLNYIVNSEAYKELITRK